MYFRFRQLTRILHFLMFHVKHQRYTESNRHHKSILKFHLLAVFFLSAFCAFNLSNIEVQAKDKLHISKVTLNGVNMTEIGDGVYSVTSYTSDALTFQFYSDEFEKLTDYNLKANISFTYPQTTQTYLNITPFYRLTSGSFTYLGQIGNIYSNGQKLAYHTKQYYDDNQPHVPPFTHGGYSTQFGSSYSTGNIETDLTYYFGENVDTANIGLYFETGAPGDLMQFPPSQRTVTVTIEYFDAVEKATIENAETTKNIFEWLQGGFVNLIVPTSDGIEDMLENTSKVIENRLGILYLPFDFIGSALGAVKSAFENASSDAFTVPSWKININNHNYTMWNEFTFSITNNAIFKKIFIDYGLILLVKITYLVFFFVSIFKTINLLTDGILALEIEYFFSDMFDDSDAIDGEWREL